MVVRVNNRLSIQIEFFSELSPIEHAQVPKLFGLVRVLLYSLSVARVNVCSFVGHVTSIFMWFPYNVHQDSQTDMPTSPSKLARHTNVYIPAK